MSDSLPMAGCSRSKRKRSEPDLRDEDIKHLAEDRAINKLQEEECEEASEDLRTKLGEHLCSQYGLTKSVLVNLSASDLRKTSNVCRSWRDWVSLELAARASRGLLHWLFWRAERSGWNVAPPLAVHATICEHVRAQPIQCLAFFSKNAPKEFRCCDGVLQICPSRKRHETGQGCGRAHPFESYLQQALGPNCKLLCYSTSGVIGCSQDLKTTFEVQYVRNGPRAMSAVLLPDFPNVKVVPFSLKKEDLLYMCMWGRTRADVCTMLGIPRDQPVQALLLFSGYRVKGHELSRLVAALQARQELRIAVGGGTTERADGLDGLVILGTGVCAASTVLTQVATEKDQVVESLTELRQCGLPQERTLGFMFSCLGRGEVWYDGEPCVESTIFNKVFPNTPLLGFFGRGEIGVNHLPDMRADSKQGSARFWSSWADKCAASGPGGSGSGESTPPAPRPHPSDADVDHTYSTSIVLLSFNTGRGR